MIFTPEFCAANIALSPDDEIYFGSDQMNICCPILFPTVTFPLRDLSGLYELADKIRMAQGYLPMLPQSKDADDESYDSDGWYNLYVGVKRLPGGDALDRCITFTVDSLSDDNGEEYTIDLDDAERKTVFDRLDAESRKKYGKSCAELLDEAAAELAE